MVRVPQDLDCILLPSRSVLPLLKKSQGKWFFYVYDEKNSQRSQLNTNWRDKTSALVISERIWRVFQYMLAHRICLYLSVLLYARTLTSVVVDSTSFKIEEFLHKMAISLKNYRVKRAKLIFPCELNWLNAQFWLFALTLGYAAWSSLSLGSAAPFGRPSAHPRISLFILFLYQFWSKT